MERELCSSSCSVSTKLAALPCCAHKPCIAHEWSECSCPSTSLASYLIHTAHVEARSYSATGATGDEEEVKLDASSNGERGQHLHQAIDAGRHPLLSLVTLVCDESRCNVWGVTCLAYRQERTQLGANDDPMQCLPMRGCSRCSLKKNLRLARSATLVLCSMPAARASVSNRAMSVFPQSQPPTVTRGKAR